MGCSRTLRPCTKPVGKECSTRSCAPARNAAARHSCPSTRTDYETYVDGKPRADGVRDLVASRGIKLPEGDADDPAGAETINGLGNRKNAALAERIHRDGVRVFEGSRRYLEAARDAGLRRAVVSSSANTEEVLTITGLAPLIELRVDGNTIREQGLRGKPAPDTFLRAADLLGVRPDQAAVFEDALAGVEAGRAGKFRRVSGRVRCRFASVQTRS
jgi:HAD superfamily hydrolase (TIGR01509 family)